MAGYSQVNPFFEQVYGVVAQIPHGKVVSYGQIAKLLGNPRGARIVGWAMRNCPEGLPWHRVVMADGSVTGGVYAALRREKLESEGIPFLPDGRVDMNLCRWM
jgi:methylated-DNA-protein-cysteine methyltransferase-like protein